MTGKGDMRGPDFLVIGAQRAGTTWIHLLLRQHKALWLPPVKELHYFDKPEVSRTVADDKELRRVILLALYAPSLWHFPYLLGKRNQDWYVRLFARGPSQRASSPAKLRRPMPPWTKKYGAESRP